MEDASVFLVPIGAGRFDLYTEAAEPPTASRAPEGFWRRWVHRLQERWREAVQAAHRERDAGLPGRAGPIARIRDWLVQHVAESMAEQRTLWSLRGVAAARFVYPSDLTDAAAAAIRTGLLTRAVRHHGVWLLVNVAGAAATAVLALLPGPNLIGYYFAFRVVGHFLSWRGARQGLDRTAWRGQGEPALAELATLAELSREARHDRVAEIGNRLQLPRLGAFFARVAVHGRG